MSVKSKMTAIADAVRANAGTTGPLTLDGMIAAIANSGVSLNFDVKAYGTEAKMLQDKPKANTIGVVTTASISNWIFAVDQPEAPKTNTVWIRIGEPGGPEFNALKTNAIQVYPISAQQYINGAWVNVTAMIYQNGWVEWAKSVSFAESNWTKSLAYRADSYSAGDFSFSENTFKGTISGSFDDASIASKTMIDLTDIGKITFKATLNGDLGSDGCAHVAVCKYQYFENSSGSGVAAAYEQLYSPVTNKECTINVSTLSGTYYILIGIATWANAGTVSFTVSDMKLKYG